MKIHWKNKQLEFWQKSTENVLLHRASANRPIEFVKELHFLGRKLSDTTPRNKTLYYKDFLSEILVERTGRLHLNEMISYEQHRKRVLKDG